MLPDALDDALLSALASGERPVADVFLAICDGTPQERGGLIQLDLILSYARLQSRGLVTLRVDPKTRLDLLSLRR